jgi:opacity protein-like surface antigen
MGAMMNFATRAALSGGVFVVAAGMPAVSQAQNCAFNTTGTPPPVGGTLADLEKSLTSLATFSGTISSAMASSLSTANSALQSQSGAFVSNPASPPDSTGGGVWIRQIGGYANVNNTGTTTASVASASPAFPFNANTNGSCQDTLHLGYSGFQTGVDIARLNVNGWNFNTGAMAGFIETNASTTGPNNSSGFAGNFQSPFFGLYANVSRGGFFAEGSARWDFSQNHVSDSAVNIINQAFNSRAVSLSGSAGYHHDLGNSWFIEPAAGIAYSRLSIDPLSTVGTNRDTNFAFAIPTFTAPAGSFVFDDITSVLGRAGVRVGTTVNAGNVVLHPFVAASVWHEFDGSGTVKLQPCKGCYIAFEHLANISASTATPGLGTYGQYSLGVTGEVSDTGWLGYGRLDFREGKNIDGIGFNAGLRYQFMPDSSWLAANAAPYKARPAATPFTWQGFYAGGFLGGLGGTSEWTAISQPASNGVNAHVGGFLGGLEAGYNWQVAALVLGVESDIGWTNAHGAFTNPNGNGTLPNNPTCLNDLSHSCAVAPRWLSTLTGRLGYSWDRALFYAKGGGAWTSTQYSTFDNYYHAVDQFAPTGQQVLGQSTVSRFGWTVGAGLEYAIDDRWSAKGEYDYIQFGPRDVTLSDGERWTLARDRVHVGKVGFNYHLGDRPGDTGAYGVDLPVKAARAEPIRNWTGFYAGANLGWGAGNVKDDITLTAAPFTPPGPLTSTRLDMDGAIAGTQFGYNWQAGNVVLGAEADFQGSTQKGMNRINYNLQQCPTCVNMFSGHVGVPTNFSEPYTAALDYFGTVRGRAGYAADSWLLYVTGGWGYGHFTMNSGVDSNAVITSGSTIRGGWAFGGGVEGAIGQNWSWKAEYLGLDFGSWNASSGFTLPVSPSPPPGSFAFGQSIHAFDNIVRVGVNYHFQ